MPVEGEPARVAEQRLLQPLPGSIVSRVEGLRGDLLGQRPPALAERIAQPREEAARLRALLRPGGLVAEQLRPGAAHACGACFRSSCFSRRAAGSRWSATMATALAAASFHERRRTPRPNSAAPTVASGPRTTSGPFMPAILGRGLVQCVELSRGYGTRSVQPARVAVDRARPIAGPVLGNLPPGSSARMGM